ncbi:hypothetical protein E2C01_051283 [Portunus trituberculatus]|uniref:Uncharacterized protein n=1 Tax=Portunus trituberculatus TaxID=210409 RepID=A0A5B7GI92_PORTR|nr:hypothetical protein [Portunus trituberculatus]
MGQQLRDTIPAATEHYCIGKWWVWLLRRRKRTVACTGENQQTGRWDCLGTVFDTPAPWQYLVCLHGSGQASLRNCRHLQPTSPDNPPGASPACDNQGDDLSGNSDDWAPTPPPSPTRPRCTVCAPNYLSDYISSPGLP